jgi:hypothetical protein
MRWSWVRAHPGGRARFRTCTQVRPSTGELADHVTAIRSLSPDLTKDFMCRCRIQRVPERWAAVSDRPQEG